MTFIPIVGVYKKKKWAAYLMLIVQVFHIIVAIPLMYLGATVNGVNGGGFISFILGSILIFLEPGTWIFAIKHEWSKFS